MSELSKSFKFYVPVELQKSEGDEDEWRIQGLASTDDEDLQGEVVDQNGLDISLLKAGRGLFNHDHQKGPENVLGEIEDAEFVTLENGRKGLMVKGYLFKHQERAKAYWNILRSLKKSGKARVHMSIEGKVIQRDFMNSKAIKKARIEKVALTLDPINPYTYADLCKSLISPEPIEVTVEPEAQTDETVTISKAHLQTILDFVNKALAAGVGYSSAPTARTGGAAMTKESLEGQVKNVTHESKKKKDKKGMLKSLMKSLKDAYPNEDPMTLAEWVLDTFVEKLEDK